MAFSRSQSSQGICAVWARPRSPSRRLERGTVGPVWECEPDDDPAGVIRGYGERSEHHPAPRAEGGRAQLRLVLNNTRPALVGNPANAGKCALCGQEPAGPMQISGPRIVLRSLQSDCQSMVDLERTRHAAAWPHAPIVASRRAARAGMALPTKREFYSGLAVLMVCGTIALMRGGPEATRASTSAPSHDQQRSSIATSPAANPAGSAMRRATVDAQEKTRPN